MDRLETRRLLLEPISVDDVDLLVELDSDPQVMRFLTGGKPTAEADVVEAVNDSLGHRWIARKRASGAFVGWFGLRPTPGDEAELGYRLRQEMWGKGFASEGSRRLIDHGFADRKLRRIWAQTMTVNTASRHVMDACGMTYVRTFYLDWPEVIDGTDQGDVEYEILSTAT